MRMRTTACLLVGICFCVLPAPAAYAYLDATHKRISETAAKASSNLGTALRNVGIPDRQITSAPGTIAAGAVAEDYHPQLRVRNHFFDPITGGGISCTLVPDFLTISAPNWALSGSDFSY